MPSINLRLTDFQHAELERWAIDGHRSLQKEIIFRLFGRQDYIEAAASFITPQGREEAARVMTGNTDLIDHFPQNVPRSSGACGMNVPAGTKCKVCGKVHPK